MGLSGVKSNGGVLHLQGGEVRTECPECDHRQAIGKPAGKVYCERCKLSIEYETGLDENSFFRLRWYAKRYPDRYRKVGR